MKVPSICKCITGGNSIKAMSSNNNKKILQSYSKKKLLQWKHLFHHHHYLQFSPHSENIYLHERTGRHVSLLYIYTIHYTLYIKAAKNTFPFKRKLRCALKYHFCTLSDRKCIYFQWRSGKKLWLQHSFDLL